MTEKQRWQVALFLRLFKETAHGRFVFAERERTIATVAELGITLAQARECVLSLGEPDYYRGPLVDKSRHGGEYWEFGATIREREVFIKLKVDTANGVAICFSFHFPESPMRYPHRPGRRQG